MKVLEPVSAEQDHYNAVAEELAARRQNQSQFMQFSILAGLGLGVIAPLGLVATWFVAH